MDWKDALSGLLADGSLPAGSGNDNETANPSDRSDSASACPSAQKSPLHVLMERKGRGGKTATIIEGFECPDEELRELASRLKRSLGTGGSARGGEILIQGDVVSKVRTLLLDWGYRVKG